VTEVTGAWRHVRLADVADTALGKMLDAARPKGGLATPYLRNSNVQWGRIDATDVHSVPLSPGERVQFLLEDGDLLVCEGGEIGRAAIWHGGTVEMAYQKALHRVRSRGDLDVRWLRYLLEQYATTGDLAAMATGSTIKHLPQRQLRELPLCLPDLAEQRRIVDLLEDHLSRLDAAEASLGQGLRRAAAYGRALLDALTTSSPAAVVPLSQLVAGVEAGRSFGSAARPAARDEWGIVKVSAMTWGEFRPGENKVVVETLRVDPRYEIQRGDLLVSRANTTAYVGAAVLVPETRPRLLLSDKSLRLVPAPGVDPAYLLAVLQSPRVRAQVSSLATGTKDSMRNISQRALLSVRVPMVDTTRQSEVVGQLARMTDSQVRLRNDLTSALCRVAVLRRTLLAAAFSGRLAGPGVSREVAAASR